MVVGKLEDAVEALQYSAVVVGEGLDVSIDDGCRYVLVHHIEQRFVIFVYEHHGTSARLLMRLLEDVQEAVAIGFSKRVLAILQFLHAHKCFDGGLQFMRLSEQLPIEVDMKYGVCVPLLFEGVDGETAEEFLASEEIVFESGHEQALAESARTAEEIDLSCCNEIIYQCCLVDVDISVFTNLAEALHSYRVFHIRVALMGNCGGKDTRYL